MNQDPANREGQKDPIFLLQRKDYTLTYCPAWLSYDGDSFWIEIKNLDGVDTSDWDFIQKGEVNERLLFEYLVRTEVEADVTCAVEAWITQSVWLTRNEAEVAAKLTDYNYQFGWRVYCVSACGSLAQVLNDAPTPSQM